MLLLFAQAVDGQKGEKGDCRMDDNLVGATHPLSSSPDILMHAAKAIKCHPCINFTLIAVNDVKVVTKH